MKRKPLVVRYTTFQQTSPHNANDWSWHYRIELSDGSSIVRGGHVSAADARLAAERFLLTRKIASAVTALDSK